MVSLKNHDKFEFKVIQQTGKHGTNFTAVRTICWIFWTCYSTKCHRVSISQNGLSIPIVIVTPYTRQGNCNFMATSSI